MSLKTELDIFIEASTDEFMEVFGNGMIEKVPDREKLIEYFEKFKRDAQIKTMKVDASEIQTEMVSHFIESIRHHINYVAMTARNHDLKNKIKQAKKIHDKLPAGKHKGGVH